MHPVIHVSRSTRNVRQCMAELRFAVIRSANCRGIDGGSKKTTRWQWRAGLVIISSIRDRADSRSLMIFVPTRRGIVFRKPPTHIARTMICGNVTAGDETRMTSASVVALRVTRSSANAARTFQDAENASSEKLSLRMNNPPQGDPKMTAFAVDRVMASAYGHISATPKEFVHGMDAPREIAGQMIVPLRPAWKTWFVVGDRATIALRDVWTTKMSKGRRSMPAPKETVTRRRVTPGSSVTGYKRI